MDFRVAPSVLTSGNVDVPGDKSVSHRALMLGAIANGTSEVSGLLVGDDCLATMRAVQAMGIDVERPAPTTVIVHGKGMHGLRAPAGNLDLGNSGTGMRLFTGLLSGQSFDSTLVGDRSLSSRPMKRVIKPLEMMGAEIDCDSGTPPLKIHGDRRLKGINYALPVATAQVKSAILLAGIYASGETFITEPAVTRDHTERMLRAMGATLTADDLHIHMAGHQELEAMDVAVPGDLSSAAFLIVAALLSDRAEILVRNVGVNPTRTGVIEILRDMGADIRIEGASMLGEEPVADLRVRASALQPIDLGPERVSLAIDEFPILFIAAAAADGVSRFSGLEELRVKESDRIASMVQGLRELGITANETEDGAEIQGGEFGGGTIDSADDHRIAMSFAIAATRSASPVVIQDVDNVDTSFPGFTTCLRSIGVDISTEDGGPA